MWEAREKVNAGYASIAAKVKRSDPTDNIGVSQSALMVGISLTACTVIEMMDSTDSLSEVSGLLTINFIGDVPL